jgi:hypothetical protein
VGHLVQLTGWTLSKAESCLFEYVSPEYTSTGYFHIENNELGFAGHFPVC